MSDVDPDERPEVPRKFRDRQPDKLVILAVLACLVIAFVIGGIKW
jgi:hypothetical protein